MTRSELCELLAAITEDLQDAEAATNGSLKEELGKISDLTGKLFALVDVGDYDSNLQDTE